MLGKIHTAVKIQQLSRAVGHVREILFPLPGLPLLPAHRAKTQEAELWRKDEAAQLQVPADRAAGTGQPIFSGRPSHRPTKQIQHTDFEKDTDQLNNYTSKHYIQVRLMAGTGTTTSNSVRARQHLARQALTANMITSGDQELQASQLWTFSISSL